MDWSLYWTYIFQILLAIAALSLPLAVAILLVTSAWKSGTTKSDTKQSIFRG